MTGSDSTTSAAAARWPLVGRQSEQDFVIARLRGDRPCGVALAGAAGIGKSRLVHEVLASLDQNGWRAASVVATPTLDAVPFGPFLQFLPHGAPSFAGDRAHLMYLLTDAIVGGADPVVVAVDDGHLLDDGSAALVHQLVMSSRAALLLTFRTGAPVPDAVRALWESGPVARVELQGLAEAEVGELLEAVLGGAVERGARRAFHATSAGSPLLLRELVLDALDTGALHRDADVWAWRGGVPPGRRLRDMVEARLGGLTRPERSVVEVVAVGEPVGADVLEHLAGVDAVELVEGKGLLVTERSRRRTLVRVAHPLYSEVLRASVPDLRARTIKRDLAAAITRRGARRSDDLLRLAVWSVDAGDIGDTVLLVRASELARIAGDPALAVRLARAAYDTDGTVAAGVALGRALQRCGRPEDAEQVLAPLVERASVAELPAVAAALADVLFWGLGRAHDAQNLLRGALQDAAPPDAHVLRGLLAGFLGFSGSATDTLAAADPVLADPDPPVGPRLRATAASSLALALAGRIAESREITDAAFADLAAYRDEDPRAAMFVVTARLFGLWLSGELAAAEQTASAFYVALAGADPFLRGAAALAVGRVALMAGRADVAKRHLAEAAVLMEEDDDRMWCLSGLAQACALRGELDEAAAHLDRAEAMRCPPVTMFVADLVAARSWVAAQRGEPGRAAEQWLSFADRAASDGQVAVEALALHEAVRVGGATSAASRLAALAARAEGPVVTAFADHAAAAVAGEGAALDAVSSAFEDAGMVLLAAEAAAEASRVHQSASLLSRAQRAAERSARLRTECGGAQTPAFAETGVHGLTNREREVAVLVAGGLSNRAIADRLSLSVRTVESHVYRASVKLGATTRRELADTLGLGGR